MTLPNKLTLLRILLIPVMVVIVSIEALRVPIGFLGLNWDQFIFAVLFVLASVTDFFDGYLARKWNQVTTFGKFLDPIADKILVFTALLYLMLFVPVVSMWSVVVILVREFAVTGIRLLAVERGHVIAASTWAKFKTSTTMVALILILFNGLYMPFLVSEIIYYIAVVLTIVSGLEYLIKNKSIIFESI